MKALFLKSEVNELKKNVVRLIVGIFLLAALLFVNNEIYQHRVYMAKAKEAIKEYKYDHATAYLKKADIFPFHKKVQAYQMKVEDKKRASIMAYIRDTEKKELEFLTYKTWIEQEVLNPTSTAFEQYKTPNETSAQAMNELFYQLNFKVESKRINLNEQYLEIHQHLTNYIQKNQLAYAYWEQDQPVEAEKIRQEAITAHTDFLIAFNDYTKQNCNGNVSLVSHFY